VMNGRSFIAVVGGSALVAPVAAEARPTIS
jgi:hypothetical protein